MLVSEMTAQTFTCNFTNEQLQELELRLPQWDKLRLRIANNYDAL